jgi:hypothetical protein
MADLSANGIHYKDVLLQRVGAFGINSIRCKELTIDGSSYAQHKQTARFTYLEHRKRTYMQGQAYGDHAFLLVVPNVPEAQPQDPFVSDGNCKRSKYASYSDMWRTDHIAQLDAAGIQPLFYLDVRAEREAVPMEPPTTAVIVTCGENGVVVGMTVPISDLSTVGTLGPCVENMSVRRELRGLPTLVGFCGPMWQSDGTVRYESAAANEALSA